MPDHGKGLVCAVEAVERAVIHAATTADRAHAVKALTIHPLIDSYTVAKRLLDAYQRHFSELDYLGGQGRPSQHAAKHSSFRAGGAPLPSVAPECGSCSPRRRRHEPAAPELGCR
ncbi:hypothetical protein [Streptomyces dysideae]|uniref:hypothetical protein n=1 Tax=Streptomyces dysideae TaxID=909626 RepID=UPI00131DD379|nr:hypothetical protein [Streptomyces dysideae]